MTSVVLDVAAWLVIASTFLAIFNTYKWWVWQAKLGGKALRYLFRSAMVVTLAAMPLAVISFYRLTQGPSAPPFPNGGPLIAICVTALIVNLTITTFAFRELDQAIRSGDTVRHYNETERGVED